MLSCALRCGLALRVHIQSINCVLYTSRRAFCSNCNAVLHGYAGWDPQPRFCTHHIQSGKCSFFVKTTAPSPICNAVLDGYAGWDPQARFKIRIVCARPYHALFMHNMLIRCDWQAPRPAVLDLCAPIVWLCPPLPRPLHAQHADSVAGMHSNLNARCRSSGCWTSLNRRCRCNASLQLFMPPL